MTKKVNERFELQKVKYYAKLEVYRDELENIKQDIKENEEIKDMLYEERQFVIDREPQEDTAKWHKYYLKKIENINGKLQHLYYTKGVYQAKIKYYENKQDELVGELYE